jgi:hypothetical protein
LSNIVKGMFLAYIGLPFFCCCIGHLALVC